MRGLHHVIAMTERGPISLGFKTGATVGQAKLQARIKEAEGGLLCEGGG